MIIWLFHMANSATSYACMLFALSLFLISRHPFFILKPRNIIIFGIMTISFFGLVEFFFGIKDQLFALLGRRPDLTTRVPMWDYLMDMTVNPFLGAGYESFWLGNRLDLIVSRWGIASQAHNGFLEMYLNMGIIGVIFIIAWIFSGIVKVSRYFLIDYPYAILRLCLITVIALYNYTEATFFGPSSFWMLFFIGVFFIPESVNPSEKLNNLSFRNIFLSKSTLNQSNISHKL